MLDTTTEAGRRAERRLREEEEVAWLTTVRADGQPQSIEDLVYVSQEVVRYLAAWNVQTFGID